MYLIERINKLETKDSYKDNYKSFNNATDLFNFLTDSKSVLFCLGKKEEKYINQYTDFYIKSGFTVYIAKNREYNRIYKELRGL